MRTVIGQQSQRLLLHNGKIIGYLLCILNHRQARPREGEQILHDASCVWSCYVHSHKHTRRIRLACRAQHFPQQWPALTVVLTGIYIFLMLWQGADNVEQLFSDCLLTEREACTDRACIGGGSRGYDESGYQGCVHVSLSSGYHRITTYLASNGIVIATEKKSSSILIDDSMLDKVAVICPNIGIVYSGMGPDSRVLIAKARKSAQAYWKIYGEYPPTRVLVQEVATVMQQATQSGYDASFCCASF